MDKHSVFLRSVRSYVEEYPEVAAFVSDHVAAGVSDALSKSRDRAADMEAALIGLLSARLKNADKLVIDKLRKWEGKTSFVFTDFVEQLEAKMAKRAKGGE